jgi:lipopolysaccharide/colanic/teichoic acid biosynthesis glycosyltransferase
MSRKRVAEIRRKYVWQKDSGLRSGAAVAHESGQRCIFYFFQRFVILQQNKSSLFPPFLVSSPYQMNSVKPTIFERFAALLCLAVIFPALLLISLLIGATAGGPTVINDPTTTTAGAVSLSPRFRTTGPGTPIFHFMGKLLKELGLDTLPALWSVVRGEIHLKDVLQSRGHG